VTGDLRGYRRWFYAAAIYNVLWGAGVVLLPGAFMQLAGLPPEDQVFPFVQVMGMMVGVYGYGYYLLARAPQRYAGFIWIGLAGKTFGPLGFLSAALTGALPWSFGWVCVFNDLIWWPVFWSFALKHARSPGIEIPVRRVDGDTHRARIGVAPPLP
jgi:small multidrug resistance pump